MTPIVGLTREYGNVMPRIPAIRKLDSVVEGAKWTSPSWRSWT